MQTSSEGKLFLRDSESEAPRTHCLAESNGGALFPRLPHVPDLSGVKPIRLQEMSGADYHSHFCQSASNPVHTS